MKKEKEIKYPILMESKQDGLVVKFADEHTGTVIKAPDRCEYNKIGDFHGCWISATNSDNWRVYNSPKLSQAIKSASEESLRQLGDLIEKIVTRPSAYPSTESVLLQYAIDQSNMNVTGGYIPKDSNENGMGNSALHSQIGGAHYKDMAIQPIEFIQKNGLSYAQGSIIKYICRYKTKNGAEDLKKAIHFIELLMEMEYGEGKK